MPLPTANEIAEKVVALLLARATGMRGGATPAAAGGSSGGGGDSAGKGLADFAQKITSLLVPISIAAAVFGAATSGMQPLIGAIKIAGMLLGTLLAPGFVVVSAVLLSLVDVVQGYLLPNLESFYGIIINGAVQAIGFLEGQFNTIMASIISYVTPFGKALEDARKTVSDVQLSLMALKVAFDVAVQKLSFGTMGGGGAGGAPPAVVVKGEDGKPPKSFKDTVDSMFKAVGLKTPEGGKSFEDRFKDNLGVVTRQMRQDAMPKAQQSDLISANMNAQMTTLNMTEYERKMIAIQEKQLEALDAVVGKLQPAVGD